MTKQSYHKVAPSVLAADFSKLGQELEMVNTSSADYLHVDVMDGRFVPNISFGQDIVGVMGKICQKPLDVHLMILEPEKYAEEFKKAGASILTVHQEATIHLHRTIQLIKSLDMQAGVALNPSTPVQVLEDVLEDIDLVCLMSVNPGFGGQKFIYRTMDKITKLRAIITERNLPTMIEVDGGVGLHNAEAILKAGADVLVAGNAVFKADQPIQIIEALKNIESHPTF